MRSTGSTARGAPSTISTPSSARRRCATPTTPICRRSPRSTPTSRRTCGCSSATGARRRAGVRDARPREEAGRRQRAARLPARRRGAARRRQGALKAVEEELAELSAQFDDNVLDATNDWALYVDDGRSSPASPTTCSREARAAADGRRQDRLEAHAAHALLSPGDELRGQPRAARDAAPRLCDARVRSGRARPTGTTRRSSGAFSSSGARRRGCSAMRTSPRSRSCRRWRRASTRCSASCATSRAARGRSPSATTPSSPRSRATSSASTDLAPWDLAYASEKLKAKRYAFSEQEVRQYFPEHKVLAGLFRVAETLYGIAIRESRAATWHPDVRFFDITRCRRRTDRPVLPRQLRAPGQAGRRVDGRRDQPPPQRRTASSIRSPTSPATCRRRSRAGRRRSRTTRSRRSSTSSATACTSCSRASTSPASRASRASNGTPSSFPASSWRISAGSGTCSRT